MPTTLETSPETGQTAHRKFKPGRPKTEDAAAVKSAKSKTFKENMDAVAAADWGTRVALWLYRLEPYTDRRKSGDTIYIMKYDEPVNEHRVMVDQGSGRYRLMLTNDKPAGTEKRTIDTLEFEILNQTYPPKIPAGEWVDDVRNKKWAWAKPGEPSSATPAAAAPAAGASFLETARAVMELQHGAREDLRSMQPEKPTNGADPLVTAMAMFREVLAVKADNPMVEIMSKQLEAERQARLDKEKRIDQLLDEIRKKPEEKNPGDPFDFIEKFKRFKDLLSGEGGDDNGLIPKSARSKMSAGAEIAVRLAEKVADSPVLGQIAQALMTRASSPPPNPLQPQQPPQPAAPVIAQQAHVTGTPAPPQQTPQQLQLLGDFIQTITAPMLNYFGDENTGGEFAEWCENGFGDKWMHPVHKIEIPWLHAVKQIGAPNILAFFRGSPYWPTLQPHEVRFGQFLNEFVSYTPAPDDDVEEGKPPVETVEHITLDEPAGALP